MAPPGWRSEHDSLGQVDVPAEHLWGAQTQRCLLHFAIGTHRYRWGRPVIRALGIVKKCAAIANGKLAALPVEKAEAIALAADEVAHGLWDSEFPLVIFQTGSGTQSNMNANEVIARRATQLSGLAIHPNDDANRSQSSNDTFPAVMHVATVQQLEDDLLPALDQLRASLQSKAEAFRDIVMVGRTHLMDAAPLTLGQAISGWVAQLDLATAQLRAASAGLADLAIGGTAVGTGLNAPADFGDRTAEELSRETGRRFRSAPNKFAALSAHEPMVAASGALRILACSLYKIANDVRWYASGPRCAIGELSIPANEPGSSIMPGKVNPTQCEALMQVAVQVYGNDCAVAFAGSQGNFQLSTFRPVMLHNVLDSVEILADGCNSFERHCVRGIRPDGDRIREHLERSLAAAAALNPHIGYERAAEIALAAHRDKLSLRAAAIRSGYVNERQFDEWVDPTAMTHPSDE